MKTSLLRVGATIAACLLFGSCTPDGGTIYSTIETEAKTTDNSLPNAMSVTGLAAPSAGTYYVAAGTIYRGVLSGSNLTWDPNKTAPDRVYNPPNGIANAMAFYAGSLWGGFITAGANLGLYSSSAAPYDTMAVDTDPNAAGKQVTLLQVANNRLFMVCAIPSGSPVTYQYELDEKASGASAWSAPLAGGLASPIVGVAWDGVSAYYAGSGTTLLSDADPPTSFATQDTTTFADVGAITGLLGDAVNQRVFVTTQTGGLYFKYGVGAWTQIPAPTVGTSTARLLSIAGPIDAAGDTYLVGTDGFGYYTFSVTASLSSPSTALTRFADVTIALYSASVSQILIDGGTVLMGTNGQGLWRADVDASGTIGAWTHE